MKSLFCLPRLIFIAITGILLTGCFRPVTVSTRRFVLTPISTNEPALVGKEELSVGIGFVKMPSYLLRSSVAIRNHTNEIRYLDDAVWVERLDRSFQRALAANLSRLLPSDRIYFDDWGRNQVMARIFINVQQFDVDTEGHGKLIARWRIMAPDGESPLKTGHAELAATGTPPHGKPEVIAATLSDLTAEFSRGVAPSIRESIESTRAAANDADGRR